MSRSMVVAALTLLAGTISSTASADDTAERLFREARQAVAAGDYEQACPKFAESQRIEPAPGTLVNLAECEEHLGAIVRARNDFALAASGFPREDPRRAYVLKHASELEQRFAHLTLRLADHAPVDAIIRRANAVIDRATLGSAVDVDPGEQRIVVTAPGRIDRRYTVHLGSGESTDIMVDVGAPSPTKTIVRTLMLQAERANGRRTAGVIVGTLGILGVGAGAVAGVIAMNDANVVTAHCPANRCDPQGFGAAREGRTAAPLSTAMFIGGGGFVLSGAMLLWASAGHSRASIAPVIGPQAAGLTLVGAF